MLTTQIKKENKFNFKEVIVSALKSLIELPVAAMFVNGSGPNEHSL
jgi:hypothetical protein